LQRPFGHSLTFNLSLSRSWLTLGPGWAALAGALAAGFLDFNLTTILKLLGLWFLADPILGTIWDLLVRQGLWRRIRTAALPPPPTHGFLLPYTKSDSPAGRMIILLRRYRLWWQESHWPEFGHDFVTFGLGLGLAFLLSLFLGFAVFGLTVMALILIWGAGHRPLEDGRAPGGGRWQTLVQFLLPWLMGSALGPSLSLSTLFLALCYSGVYLGGLRMLDRHRHAAKLFFLGQFTATLLLLALRLLPVAALAALFLIAQWLLRTRFDQPPDFLDRAQPYLVLGLLIAGFSVGRLGWL
jgi:hypothetical protein